ncbi:MAG: STAS domain-containing protein [Xanthomonadales bacterium]|nr:STAS domain-containing protein [Xanthomonadales bacterium]
MFDIQMGEGGQVVISGRLDAANAEKALAFLNGIESNCAIDMSELEYISSAGLGVLLRTHKRLMQGSGGLKLVQVGPHIRDIFTYSGFDKLFEIETA